jgi:hypothetical protein
MRLSMTIVADQAGSGGVRFSVLVNGTEVAKNLGFNEAQTVVDVSLRRLAQSAELPETLRRREDFLAQTEPANVSVPARPIGSGHLPHDIDTRIAGFAAAAAIELQTELTINVGMEELLASLVTRDPSRMPETA